MTCREIQIHTLVLIEFWEDYNMWSSNTQISTSKFEQLSLGNTWRDLARNRPTPEQNVASICLIMGSHFTNMLAKRLSKIAILWSGAKTRKLSCRFKQNAANENWFARIGFDTAENKFFKVIFIFSRKKLTKVSSYILTSIRFQNQCNIMRCLFNGL